MQNSLIGKTFNDDEAVKSHLVQFFADKDQKFYERGIMKLPESWQNVMNKMRNISLIKDHSLYLKRIFICMKKSAITSGTIHYHFMKHKSFCSNSFMYKIDKDQFLYILYSLQVHQISV